MDPCILEQKRKRSQYKSLEEFVAEEGVEAMLAFLAYGPTVAGDKYRHSQMKTVPYRVQKIDMGPRQFPMATPIPENW